MSPSDVSEKRLVIVTGGTRGIGEGVSRRLASAGFCVLVRAWGSSSSPRFSVELDRAIFLLRRTDIPSFQKWRRAGDGPGGKTEHIPAQTWLPTTPPPVSPPPANSPGTLALAALWFANSHSDEVGSRGWFAQRQLECSIGVGRHLAAIELFAQILNHQCFQAEWHCVHVVDIARYHHLVARLAGGDQGQIGDAYLLTDAGPRPEQRAADEDH